jgi:UDP-sugar pyrophosphorylase
MNSPLEISTKPHGHGDVHILLHLSGTANKWSDEGRKWIVFFQDTNGVVFRAIPAAIGVSAEHEFEVNSMTVPRRPGEAVGGICCLKNESTGGALTINVEYNQLDPLLRASVSPEGDVADGDTGFSPYPGNINVLVFNVPKYGY